METLAASVFPENIEKMNAAETSNITPSDLENKNIFDDISYVETRPVSDTEELTYIETRAGVAGYLYQKTWQTNSSTAMTGATRYNRNIIVVVLGCTGSVYVRGLTYDINYNAADVIISPGTVTGGVTNSYLVEHWFEKNYTTPAKVSYMGTVTDLALGFAVPVDFYVTIGNNQVHVFTFNNVEI